MLLFHVFDYLTHLAHMAFLRSIKTYGWCSLNKTIVRSHIELSSVTLHTETKQYERNPVSGDIGPVEDALKTVNDSFDYLTHLAHMAFLKSIKTYGWCSLNKTIVNCLLPLFIQKQSSMTAILYLGIFDKLKMLWKQSMTASEQFGCNWTLMMKAVRC